MIRKDSGASDDSNLILRMNALEPDNSSILDEF